MARIIDGRSVVLLVPETDEEKAWLGHVGKDNGFQPYWPDRVVVEPRYLAPVLEALLTDTGGEVQ